MSHDGRSQGGGGGGGCAGGPGTTTSPQGSPITLSVPRPDHQRTTNLYVDTPFKHRVAPRLRPGQHPSPAGGRAPHSTDLPLVHGAPARTSGKRPSAAAKLTAAQTSLNVGTTVKGGSLAGSTTGVTLGPQGSRAPVISKQPAALTFTKGGRDDIDGESIICSWCGRCRCEACTKPRPPPAAWLCRNKCLCSPAAVVDYASCLCCVKGVLYHCSKDGDADFDSAADHPCSCGGPHALRGWACLALASVPLPCLLCYWPLTAARRLLESTYQRCTSHGCRCPQGVGARHHPPPPPEKRPLHDCA
ncbi:protein sprouty-like [Penaeus monodon]|uniref:protein sprouty-like n=1 Tax=Penaeus monodon TaxID=6687 RepID=UPI0018A76CAC|nr:protein sprouty-like [Penaeus monodon]XP_037777321.1 protein sprouty-like [Penaeus monodon]